MHGEVIDLVRRVPASDHPVRSAAIRVEAGDDDVALPRRPLALHAHQAWPQVENEVIPLIVDWPAHTDVEADAFGDDGGLGNQPF